MILKIKFFLLIGICLLLSTQSFAQKRSFYFLKNDGREVKQKDSADFIRVIQEPDSGSINYKVLEYYPDNSRKFVGEVSSFNTGMIYEGTTILFYKNGKKSEQITYLNGAYRESLLFLSKWQIKKSSRIYRRKEGFY